MKGFIAVSFIALGLVSAQTLPACADSCLSSAIAKSGCSATDTYCQCTTGKTTITSDATTCLLSSTCTQNDLTTIESAVAASCSAALASHSAGASSGSSSASTKAASATGSSTASTVEAAATSATSSAASSSTASGSSSSTSSSSTSSSTAKSGANVVQVGGAVLSLSLLALLAL